MDRVIPEQGSVFYKVRVCDEEAGTFVIAWQHVVNGTQRAIVDANGVELALPAVHDVTPIGNDEYFLPNVSKDPDPEDTARRRAEVAAAEAAAAAATARAQQEAAQKAALAAGTALA